MSRAMDDVDVVAGVIAAVLFAVMLIARNDTAVCLVAMFSGLAVMLFIVDRRSGVDTEQ